MAPKPTATPTAASPEIVVQSAAEALRLAQAEFDEANRALTAIRDRTEGRVESTTAYLAEAPLNPGVYGTVIPASPRYAFDPVTVLEAKLAQPAAELRFQQRALALRKAEAVHADVLRVAQRARVAEATPRAVADYAALVADCDALVARYQTFAAAMLALIAQTPVAEQLLRDTEMPELEMLAGRLPMMHAWLAREHATTNGGG